MDHEAIVTPSFLQP